MKKNQIAAVIAAMTMAAGGLTTVNAMPGDLKEAYDQAYYDQYFENYGSYPKEYHTDVYYSYVDYANGENFSAIGKDYVCTGSVNVRDYPNGNVIDGTVKGQTYYVEGVCTDCHWYKVSGFGQDAYVYADYLVPKESYQEETQSNSDDGHDFQEIDLRMIADVDVNMREVPGGNIVDVLRKGEEIHVTGKVNNRTWYRCDYNGENVYISDDYLIPELPQTMICTHDYINVRESADINSKVIGVLRKGDKIKVSAMEGDWYKFTSDKIGKTGYIFDQYLGAI